MAIQRDKITASAEKLVAKGKIEAAIKEYDRLIEENPSDVNTLNRIGDLWSRINRNDEAVKVFTKIADHYSKDGFFLKAIAIYKKINKLDPSKLDIYAKLADLYAKQGLAMEAKSQYQVLADFNLKQGDHAGALAAYKKIADIDPNSLQIAVKLADLYSQLGQTAPALEQYEKVGRSLLRRGMIEEAGQVYRKAVRLDPENLALAESAVQSLTEAGDQKAASEIIRAALEKAPANPRLIARLGSLHLASGDVAEARDVLERGLEANPTNESIRRALAELHIDEGDSAGAWRVLAPVVDEAIARGDSNDAITVLEKLVALDSSHVEALARLVRAYEKAGQNARVISAMTRLAEAHTTRGELDEALRVTDDLVARDRANASQHTARARDLRGRLGLESPAPSATESFDGPVELDYGGEDIMLDDSPAIDLDFGSMSEGSAAPPRSERLTAVPPVEEEDIAFVTEHLTEAEVFHKYGLTDKAVEHLAMITSRYPSNAAARERLVRVWMDEGDAPETERAGRLYADVLKQRGQSAPPELLEDLRSRGFEAVASTIDDIAGGLPAVSAAPSALLPDLDFGDDEAAPAKLDFGVSGEPAELPVDDVTPEVEIDLDTAPEIEVELDLDDSISLEMGSEPISLSDDSMPEYEPEVAEPSLEEFASSFGGTSAPVDLDDLPSFDLGSDDTTDVGMGIGTDDVLTPESVSAEQLGEVDFYLEQDLIDEAEARLVALEERYGESEELVSRRERLEEARSAAETPPEISPLDIETELLSALPGEDARMSAARPPAASPVAPISLDDEAGLFDDEEGFFDLAAELEQELQEDDEVVAVGEEEQSLEDIFREFKKGVEQQLDSEDYETHYNLGIAYKEMGLIDEAIAEFQLASKDPKRAIECCSMLGLCFLEKGMPQLSIKWYQKGLEAPEVSKDEQLGLLYDLGAAYLEVGDVTSAQKAFVDVYGINSSYRDVADRIRDLEDVNR